MPYYSKMRERPPNFRLNSASRLYSTLLFAGLGQHYGATYYQDESARKSHGTLINYAGAGNTPADKWQWDACVRRFALGANGGPGNGSGDYVLLPLSVTGGLLPTTPLTLSWWEKVGATPATYPAIWGLKLPDTSEHWVVFRCSDVANYSALTCALCAATDTFKRFSTAPTLASCVGVWHHWALVCAGGVSSTASTDYTCYVDGVAYAASAAAIVGTNPNAQNQLFWDSQGNEWKGSLADPLILARTLSASEIVALSDPSNVDLRIGRVPLILPMRPRVFGAGTAEAGEPTIIELPTLQIVI